MVSVRIGNIRITQSFARKQRYTKEGRLVFDTTVRTIYQDVRTGRTATAAQLAEAGIRKRAAPSMKLTPENAQFLFQKAQRAEAGAITAKGYAGLIASKTFSLPTAEQQKQFKDALITMFGKTNPSEDELKEFKELIDQLSPEECQEFFQRHQRVLDEGFAGYHSNWSTLDRENMPKVDSKTYTGNMEPFEIQRINRDTARPKILNAARAFVAEKRQRRLM